MTQERSETITLISADHKLLDLRLDEVWEYRDLITLYARRSLVATYKQTVLGPLWLILNPLLTAIVYMFIFGNVAGLSTEGVPRIVFYLMSNATWILFSTVAIQCADTFVKNADVFGKVYFPRLTIPCSVILVSLFQFAVQFVLGVCIGLYYSFTSDFSFTFARWPLIIPLIVLESLMALGFGIIASNLTTRYRDLRVLVDFGIRLWMFVTPVVYPLSQFGGSYLETVLTFNPMTAPLEAMRWCLWGTGQPSFLGLAYFCMVTIAVLLVGIVLFNKVERTFMDTV